MALGRQGEQQVDGMVGWAELPRSPGHAFAARLQVVLIRAGFAGFAEAQRARHDAGKQGRPALPPGRYFRMHLVGYLEGIDSERGLAWRCADSLSWREFLRLGTTERVPDHSWLSKTRSRLPLEVHAAVFARVLRQLAEHGLIRGDRIGVDAATMEANAARRAIVRRDRGEDHREMLHRLAKESGIETPTADDLIRLDRNRPGSQPAWIATGLDRNRQGKRPSNADWASPADPGAKIAKMKDGRTRLADKPEHAVDLDSGAIVAAAIDPADQGATTTLPETLKAAAASLAGVGAAPTPDDPAELVADQGHHSRDGLQDLEEGPWKSRIAEKKTKGVHRRHGDADARRAVDNNRARLRSGVAGEAFRLRGEPVERSFALTLDRGGMRRAWLRGRENLHQRYPVHVAGYNLGLIMPLLVGSGTPRAFMARVSAHLLVVTAAATMAGILIVAAGTEGVLLVVSVELQQQD